VVALCHEVGTTKRKASDIARDPATWPLGEECPGLGVRIDRVRVGVRVGEQGLQREDKGAGAG
jgi:hypothetical protein